MIRCNTCSKSMTEVKFIGPVLIAEGVASIEDGIIQSISPINAVQTIRAGNELDPTNMREFQFVCANCGHKGPMTDYTQVNSCILTGDATSFTVETDLGPVSVREDLVDMAVAIFSSNNANWHQPEL